jgi:carbonic anhydrase/acetyltransferase-like protein (isoleucine patch superfamily)
MIRCNPQGDYPRIHKSVFVSPSAEIIGKVNIGENVFVGPCAVIRADEPGSSIVIKKNVNVQDRVVVHALAGSSVVVGVNASLSHACIIHGPCEIGRNCFVGFGSVVFRSVLGSNVFIKSLSAVEGVRIPRQRLIPSGSAITSQFAAGLLQKAAGEHASFSRKVVRMNLFLSKNYKKKEANSYVK